MHNPFKDCRKKFSSMWTDLKLTIFYCIHLCSFNRSQELKVVEDNGHSINDKWGPEEIWEIFLSELDYWFNQKCILLPYALSSACAATAVRTGVYVLEDHEYDIFSYNDVIFERVKNRYVELFEMYFHIKHKPRDIARKNAIEHVMEEYQINLKEMDEIMEKYLSSVSPVKTKLR